MSVSKNDLGTINLESVLMPEEKVSVLPEKVLQFGTGIKELPVFLFDSSDNEVSLTGRMVVVKSPAAVDDVVDSAALQPAIEEETEPEELKQTPVVSRILSAQKEWDEILTCANNPDLQLVILTTEDGITLDVHDSIHAHPPVSFPCKLLAFLYKRYWHFKGDVSKGVLITAGLSHDSGMKLESILFELAHFNNVDPGFMDWLESAIHFSDPSENSIPVLLSAAHSRQGN